MDVLDDSENNAKISDSAYSNSCSNSQSRKSRSSKSTHSGSNSSGSSGYGGKPSTSSGSSGQLPEKRTKEKDSKKKNVQCEIAEIKVDDECRPLDVVVTTQEIAKEDKNYVDQPTSPVLFHTEKGPESMDLASPKSFEAKNEVPYCNMPLAKPTVNTVTSGPPVSYSNGFSCVISMHDGIVMYTTSSLTSTLGFQKDMWTGRSFIDFIHPRDRSTFASQITNGLAVPKIVNGTRGKVPALGDTVSTMVCRIRRYRGLTMGYVVKERSVTYIPFLLKLSFKRFNDEEGSMVYLVIQATPFYSAFSVPNEIVIKPVPFVVRHAANGNLEYIDTESVPYLGYLPQDLIGKDALQLYHPEDLSYLEQVYETIVKEGGLARCNPYRMLTQNGDFVTLHTEWSSFINPWSRKLEFIIGKHHVIEGPANPDVFHVPEIEKLTKAAEEEKKQQQAFREKMIKIMNEVLTKPAEAAKQQMSKRCQDLAAFMEGLMEDQPKTDDEPRIDLQDPDHCYYERDSMLGGISPHHDFHDSKSSTETPLSYNQLNYNDNMQRYFDSQQPFSYEDYNTVTGENVLGLKDNISNDSTSKSLVPMDHNSGDPSNSCDSDMTVGLSSISPMCENQHVRLTELLLIKHNTEMEKELLRIRRETRLCSKGEREKTSNENRQKKKEHLARCNASFQPTAGVGSDHVEKKHQGVKRSSKQVETDTTTHKHHCPSARQIRRSKGASAPNVQTSTTATANVVETPTYCHPNQMNNMGNMNAFFVGVGIPQQVSVMSPIIPQQMAHVGAVPAMSGIFPMYYTPGPNTTMASTPTVTSTGNANNQSQYTPQAMQCMMYGQATYGTPFMYSSIGPQMSYPMQQTMLTQSSQYTNMMNSPQNTILKPLGLTNSNYEEACKTSLLPKSSKSGGLWREQKKEEAQVASSKTELADSAVTVSSTNVLNRECGANSSSVQSSQRKTDNKYTNEPRSSTNGLAPKTTDAVRDPGSSRPNKPNSNRMQSSDDTVDRTDGESSYSSFYSSFFKTDTASAEDSGDPKKNGSDKRPTPTSDFWDKNARDEPCSTETPSQHCETKRNMKVTKRNMVPPWMEHVCVTSELIYKYQILTKNMEEVLSNDKQKMSKFSQPSMVNEQLGQLYLDMQLEGVAARLTLEEGITSSSSSGEETVSNFSKIRRKREHSRLVMIYEEDAPLPSAEEESSMSTV